MDLQSFSVLLITRGHFLRDDLIPILNRSISGAAILQAASLPEARQALAVQPNLILLDLFTILERLDPDECKALRQLAGSIPIICLLPADTRDYRDAAVACGANGIIFRERLSDDLLPVIGKLLAGANLSSGINQKFKESARRSAPAGESLFENQSGPSLENLSLRAVEHWSAQIAPLPASQPEPAPGSLFLRHLTVANGVSARAPLEKTMRTACNHDCGFHFCGMQVTVRGDHIVKIEPAPFPQRSYRGICQKGISYVQIIAHPDRLLYPLKRVGPRGAGQWQRISWDQALDEIAAKIQALSAPTGPESMMFLTSKGQAGVINGFFGIYLRLASLLGASCLDPNSLGLDSGVASGFEDAFGKDAGFLSNAFEDLPNSKLVLIWGGNPIQSWMPWWQFFLEAKQKGARLVTIDPRFTPTAARSDAWLPIQPGTDVLLALALIHLIIEQGWADLAYLVRHTVGPFLVQADTGLFLPAGDLEEGKPGADYLVWDQATGGPVAASQAQDPALSGVYTVAGHTCRPAFDLLRQTAGTYSLSQVAEKTGLSETQIFNLAKEYATTRPSRIFTAFGVERWYHASTFGRLLATLAALTGNVGVSGGGAGVSGFFEFPVHLSDFAYPAGQTFRPVNPATLPEYIVQQQPYPIKGLFVAFCNWLNQFPDRNYLLQEVLPRLELLVSAELFMTETAKWADYVLPVATFFEREDMVKGPGPYIQYQPKIAPPPGECRSDLEIAAGLARRFQVESYFSDPPAAYLEKILAQLDPTLDHAAFETLREQGLLTRRLPPGVLIPHTDGQFSTPTGRVEFYVQRLAQLGLALPDYEPPVEAGESGAGQLPFPLICISAHSHYRVNSIFGQAPWLKELDPEPYAFLHPDTAGQRQIQDGDWVRMFNDRGYAILKARLTQAIPPAVVYINPGWWPESYLAGHVQNLTHRKMNYTNALGPSMIYSDTRVEVTRAVDAMEKPE